MAGCSLGWSPMGAQFLWRLVPGPGRGQFCVFPVRTFFPNAELPHVSRAFYVLSDSVVSVGHLR